MKKSNFLITALFFTLSFIVGKASFSQSQDRSGLRISLFTCSPGEELYSIFGHSAIRIVDSVGQTDVVFNYGMFNFNDDGFYVKFARGKLDYFISPQRFEDFVEMYKEENRSITEQVLKLSESEKIALQHALIENCKEPNKYYKYDFFLDNCTTRLRDILRKYTHPAPQANFVMPEKTRFREAIHQYLESGGQYWSELGIDILLGLPTDKVMTADEQQFLPDNLKAAIDKTNNRKMVSGTNIILTSDPSLKSKPSSLTPKVVFWSLLLLIIGLGFSKNRYVQISLNIFDSILFFITGALGVLLILMWTATDHSMTKNNFNLIWALPTHIIATFLKGSSKKWVSAYFFYTACMMAILVLSWYFLPQQLNTALIPLVLLLMYRSYTISQKKK